MENGLRIDAEDRVHGRIVERPQRVVLRPAVGGEHGDAGGRVEDAGVAQERLHGHAGKFRISILALGGVLQQELRCAAAGLRAAPACRSSWGRRVFSRIVAGIAGKTVGGDLIQVAEAVAVGIDAGDGGDGGGVAAGREVVAAVGVQGLGQRPFLVVAVLEMAPLAAAEDDLGAVLFQLAAAMAQGAVVQLAAGFAGVGLKEIDAIALTLVVVGGETDR